MTDAGYVQRREELRHYFDRTAIDAWKRFATDQPLSRIRATVREGRDAMRATILARFANDLSGMRILDAGCGAGALSMALADRGADVLGVDLSPEIVRFAEDRLAAYDGLGRIRYVAGDMLSPDHGRFDAVVAMDSLIHYRTGDVVKAVASLAERTGNKIVFTFAPRTPLLATMHTVGRLFPRGDRAPAIEPVSPTALARRLQGHETMAGWRVGGTSRIARGFYISEAMEVSRA